MLDIAFEDIPESGIELSHELEEGWVSPLLSPQFIADPRPLHAMFFLVRSGSSVLVSGTIRGDMKFVCSRCAEEAPYQVVIDFKHVFIKGHESAHVKLNVSEELEFTFFDGDRVDLEPLAAEELVLSLPQVPLCSATCKGICQHCGKNLNEGLCNCHADTIDPRWAKLRDIKL